MHYIDQVSPMSTTLHALDRRTERGIKSEFIELCKSWGMRINVSKGGGGPCKSWVHKFMLHGLNVIASPCGTVITAYWSSDNPVSIQQNRKWFADVIAKRSVEKREHEEHKRLRATSRI